MKKRILLSLLFCFIGFQSFFAQHSIARKWNEVLLQAIRNDLARPTAHARNLFHLSALMYDSWAVYDPKASTYFLENEVIVPFKDIPNLKDRQKAVETTLSYACHKLIVHRFKTSPGSQKTIALADSLLKVLGYDDNFVSEDYALGDYAALGNYMANQLIAYGLEDGSNEANDYKNNFYTPKNKEIDAKLAGNPNITHPNNWQPLTFDVFIDQNGNPLPGKIPSFMGAEWGFVKPFALTEVDKTWKTRDGIQFPVYLDPGAPDYIDSASIEDQYKWGFLLVAMWSSHMHPSDDVKWDISPASMGNVQAPLSSFSDIRTFYKDTLGGDIGTGYALNPVTGLPYTPQIVNRGDYARVLAEFWADGPKSETPPGHWFTILNKINDNPLLIKKYKGVGEVLGNLEWDVKSYFALGGAMHDCAITAWGIKGYYDYIRPVSAIRYMVDQGQSSDPNQASYSPHGIPLVKGFSELVKNGDPLAGADNKNVGKIKLYAWRGPRFISNPLTDDAGVGWILGEEWWPYQRPTFISPPFAGFVSGHSTYSRAAADVLTEITGSPYFPGGLGEFVAKKNAFLVFEEGPSEDIVMQWATYRDAANQTSLSRIWGGIHPPQDDFPGRLLGEKIAKKTVDFIDDYFDGSIISVIKADNNNDALYPNPIKNNELVSVSLKNTKKVDGLSVVNVHGKQVPITDYRQINDQLVFYLPLNIQGFCILKLNQGDELNTYNFFAEQ